MHNNRTRDKTRTCQLCSRWFASHHRLKLHEYAHGEEKPYKCRFCDKAYVQVGKRNVHEQTHTEETLYQCRLCLASFFYLYDLTLHEKMHAKEKQHRCQSSHKAFVQTEILKTCEKTHASEKQYESRLSYCIFTNADGRDFRMRSHTEQKPRECEPCNEAFVDIYNPDIAVPVENYTEPSEPALKRTKPYKYTKPALERTKPYKYAKPPLERTKPYKYAKRAVQRTKPYSCLFCDKAFNHVSMLKLHIQIHAGHKPYSCPLCTESFTLCSLLNTHLTTHARNLVSTNLFIVSLSKNLSNMGTNFTTATMNCTVQDKMLYSTMHASAFDTKDDQRCVKKITENRIKKTSVLNSDTESVHEEPLPAMTPPDTWEQMQTKDKFYTNQSTTYADGRPSVVTPYGCGVCNKMFETEKEFFEHCSHHCDTPVDDWLF